MGAACGHGEWARTLWRFPANEAKRTSKWPIWECVCCEFFTVLCQRWRRVNIATSRICADDCLFMPSVLPKYLSRSIISRLRTRCQYVCRSPLGILLGTPVYNLNELQHKSYNERDLTDNQIMSAFQNKTLKVKVRSISSRRLLDGIDFTL